MNTTVLVLCCLLTIISRIAALDIIPPYPKNEIAIEGDSLAISCTAKDTSGYPSKVVFVRRDKQHAYHEIQNSERVYMTNTTRNDTNGLTRTTVLHITSVQPSDHYNSGPYQCWAYPATHGKGSVDKPVQHVFNLYVISKSDLPRATVNGTTSTLGRRAELTCDVTYTGDKVTAPLESLAWVKDTKTVKNGSTNSINSLIFTAVSARDGGVYKCIAVVRLQSSKPVNISLGTAIHRIRVKFFGALTKVVGTEWDRVVMECPAEGYPLNITWLRRLNNGTQVPLKDAMNKTMAKRYVVTRPCSYCRYRLTISSFRSHDAGRYVCKANEGGQHGFDLLMSGCLVTMVSFHTVLVGVLVGLMFIS